LVIVTILFYAFFWHAFLFFLQIDGDLKTEYKALGTMDDLMYILCYRSTPLWRALLRDGLYFIIVICSTVSLHFCHQPSSLICESFDEI